MTLAPAYISPCGAVTLYHADALDVLAQPIAPSIDAVITDPPYSSGGAFRGDRMQSTTNKYVQSGQIERGRAFDGDNRDQRSFRYWVDLWLRQCRRVSVPGAPICLFTDWRQLPTMTDALQGAGWVWRGVAVWDKTEGSRPQMGRFRSQAEYVAWGSNGPMPADTTVGVLPGVFRHSIRKSDKFHQTGKPTPLMEQVVQICKPGGIVLDPFTGSGSTAVGCIRQGRRFIGCEIDAEYLAVAIRRIEQELARRGQVQGVAA